MKRFQEIKTETFANALEQAIQAIDNKSVQTIVSGKSELRADLYNELRIELATKEFVRAEVSEIKRELDQQKILLKVLIGLITFGFTLSNPTFLELVKAIL